MPKVSVIMPSYNHEVFVGEAIQSVLQQDYQDYELLIADDCSSDGSVEVIKTFTDDRIRTFFLTENIGATEILRFLIERANGEYIALLNSDDQWRPGKLSKQVQFLESNREYAACFTWADFIDERGQPLPDDGRLNLRMFMQKNRAQSQWLEYFFFHGNCLCHPSVLIRKSVYESLGFYNGAFRQLPDFAYWVKLCTRYPFYILEEVLVDHRRMTGEIENTSAVSSENSGRLANEASNILTWMFENVDDELFIRAFQNRFIHREAAKREEIICEKYFLLRQNPVFDLKNQACQFYMDHYQDSGVADCFREKYGFRQADFYAANIPAPGRSDCRTDSEDLADLKAMIYFGETDFTPGNAFSVKPLLDGQNMVLRFALEEDAKKVRVDPVEGYGIIIRHADAYVNGKSTRIKPLNCSFRNSMDSFFTTDPQYILRGRFKRGDAFEITFSIESIIRYFPFRVRENRIVKADDFEEILCAVQKPYWIAVLKRIANRLKELFSRRKNPMESDGL